MTTVQAQKKGDLSCPKPPLLACVSIRFSMYLLLAQMEQVYHFLAFGPSLL